MPKTASTPDFQPAGLLVRLTAMVYDLMLLLAILFIVTALALVATGGALHTHNPFFRSALFLVMFLFYAWFWTHGGQTLGMKAWRLRVQDKDGGPIGLWQALLRFMLAIPSLLLGGLGFFWMLVDRDRMTLYDRYSESVMVRLPKPD